MEVLERIRVGVRDKELNFFFFFFWKSVLFHVLRKNSRSTENVVM